MKSVDIINKINELKKKGTKMISNCYLSFATMPQSDWTVIESDKSLIILICDNLVERLYFYTIDFNDFNKLLQHYNNNPVIEFICKNSYDYENELKESGYYPLTHLRKVSNSDISVAINERLRLIDYSSYDNSKFASKDHIYEMHELLFSVFDPRISHLLTIDELKKHIDNKEFIICQNKTDQIESLIQLIIKPRSCYVNQVINKGDKNKFHLMVTKALSGYCNKGGRYVYAWVEEGNIASLKFFAKYNMFFDGTVNTVFVRT